MVRGLDYYTKTVFVFDSPSLGAQSEFCGGGRYNQLVSQLGGKVDQPSIGAAIGIDRTLLLLEQIRDTLALPQQPALHVILPIEEKQYSLALLLADTLQHNGLCTDVLLEGGSIKSMMRKANKMGAKYALIVGADEQQEKKEGVKIKKLRRYIRDKINVGNTSDADLNNEIMQAIRSIPGAYKPVAAVIQKMQQISPAYTTK